MTRDRLFPLAALAALAATVLAGCNQTSTSAAMPAASAGSSGAQMPAGAGCTGTIGRFRVVIDNENRVGQVSPSVYRQVDAEVSRAEAACAAGRDAEAERMLATTKARHGYPA
jgi:hypothetical protein